MNQSIEDITLVDNPIYRPDEPRHFMVMDHLKCTVSASVTDHTLAISESVIAIKEIGKTIYDTQYYFPMSDVAMDFLVPISHTTTCPLKGTTQYFNALISGTLIERAAWCYVNVFDFDERLSSLLSRIAFDKKRVQVIERSTFNT